MASIFLCGDRLNAAAYGTVSVSPAADTSYPSSRLIDQFLDEFWEQGSIAADSYIRCDLNQVVNSGFETYSGGAFTGWTSNVVGGGSTVTQDSGIKKAGTYSAKFTTGAGGGSKAEVTQSLTVRSGQKWRGSFSMYAGAGGVTKLEVWNPYTKNYLNSSGTWQASQAYHKSTVGTAAWEDFTTSFTVEAWATCQSSLTSLQLRFVVEIVSKVGYADEVYFWPEVNTVVLTGHNVEAGLPIQWRSSTDNFGASDVLVATLPARAGVAYSYQSTAVITRYVALKFSGTPVAKLRATEVFWGYGLSTSETPAWGYAVKRSVGQIRSSRASVRFADFSLDAVTLSFTPAFVTQWPEIETEIFERCSAGQMIIAIPDTSRTPIFIGRAPVESNYRPTSFAMMETSLTIEPLALGTWLP